MWDVSTIHLSVLKNELVDGLVDHVVDRLSQEGGSGPLVFVDGTFGAGGHTLHLLEKIRDEKIENARVYAFDQDESAVQLGSESLRPWMDEGKLKLFHGKFSQFSDALEQGECLAGVMADLGYSSDQLEDPERGLSFMRDGPLDMRLNPAEGQSAFEWLSEVRQAELERVLREYGEERFAGRIARNIVEARIAQNLPQTTLELAALIDRCVPGKRGKVHPATRSFQAIRIQINDELGELDSLLEHAILKLEQGARIGIISFHSLEDRMVKRAFSEEVKLGQVTLVNRKPIVPTDNEVKGNSRARSAKLRFAQKGDLVKR